MAKILVCLVGCLLVAATAHAEEEEPRQLNTTEAFRQCSLAQKADPRTLTDAGKQAARSCVKLGIAYEHGNHVDESGKPIPVSYTLAARYYEIGCKLTVAFGCMAMGHMIEGGLTTVGKGKDPRAVALGWYSQGCFAKDQDTRSVALSCSSGGGMALALGLEKKNPHMMDKWVKAGVALCERGCQLGDDTACRELVKLEQSLSELK